MSYYCAISYDKELILLLINAYQIHSSEIKYIIIFYDNTILFVTLT